MILPEKSNAQSETFREAFGRRYRCEPELFSRKVLRRTLHWSGWLMLALPPPWRTRFLHRDIAFLEQAGEARSRVELKALVNDYRYSVSLSAGFLAKTLRLRLSGKRVLDLHRKVIEAGPRNGPEANLLVRRAG